MARPIKKGLDYFPLDCDFLNDEKIIAVKVHCGAKGIAVTIALLCAIYRNGYYTLWNESTALKITNDLPGCSPDLVGKVVELLAKYDFFDKELFSSESILTSRAIQKRYVWAARFRKRPANAPFWLLPADPEPEAKSKPKTSATSAATRGSRAQPSVPPPEPTAPDPPPSVDREILMLPSDEIWRDSTCMKFHISPDRLPPLLDEFAVECHARGRHFHDSISDCQSHFTNWLSKHLYAPEPQPNPKQSAPRRRQPPRPACGLIEG